MKRLSCTLLLLASLSGLFFPSLSNAATQQKPIHLAVSANFLATLKQISQKFTKQTGIPVYLSNGATGMLYAQIKRGAPYDLFFAADARRPELLEQAGLIEPNSRFAYVKGKLVVWSRTGYFSTDLAKLVVTSPQLRYFAIANPKSAPYGRAAKQVLEHYGLYRTLLKSHQLALGENVGKTFHYVATGNAQIGLLAKSYLMTHSVKGHFKDVDESLYSPIIQQAVVLKGKKSSEVQQFLDFFRSEAVQVQLQKAGYDLPQKGVK